MRKGFYGVFNYISDPNIFIETRFNKQKLKKHLTRHQDNQVFLQLRLHIMY